MKKRKLPTIVLMLVFFIVQIFSQALQTKVVKAEEIADFPFITGVSVTDLKDQPLKDGIDKSSEVRVKYTFAIPNTGDVKAGDTYKMKMPKQIAIQYAFALDIKDSKNGTLGKVTFNTNGDIIITFSDYASTHSNVSGYFYVDTVFDKSNIGNTNPQKIVFDLGGNSNPVTISINFEQPSIPATSIEKSGSYDPSTNQIMWTVKVNKEKVTVKNGQVIDNIPIGQEYVENSATIDNGGDTSKFSYRPAEPGDTAKTGTLKYTFPETINDVYKITFKTKVTDPKAFEKEGDSTKEYNTVTLNHDGTTISNTASVTVTTNYIDKSGKYVEMTSESGSIAGRIDWTIKVNNNAQVLTNAKINDKIPEGLTLTAGSFKVNGSVTTGYTYNNNTLEYTFQGIIDKPQTITFSTDVTDPNVYNSNAGKTYTNTVTLSGEGVNGTPSSTSNGVGVPSNVIRKTGVSYDPSAHYITWKIIVNNNKINIDNAVVTDNIPVGQKYVEDSATIDQGADIKGFEYVPVSTGDTSKTGTLTYKFSGTINKTYTITFKTEIMDNNVFGVNKTSTEYNTAVLTGSNIPQSSSTGSINVTSEVINKSNIGYDYTTRELTWKVVINKNAMPIKNAVVTDNIPLGQEYVENSATIDSDGDVSKFSYVKAASEDKEKTGILTYTFSDTINKTYTITFKTKITDLTVFKENGDKTLKNKASLTGDVIPPGVSSEGTKTIGNTVIAKSADYKQGNNYIDWNVVVNSNAIPLDNATIEDNLQEGLALDTISVTLYKEILNPNGTLTKGDLVQLNEKSVKYDMTTRKFTFTFPEALNGPYLLSFRTNVTDKSKSPFKNSASFKGSKTEEDSTSGNVNVVYQGGGSGGTGETGSITVVKVDSKDNTKKLQGATFNLIDRYKNVINTGTTNIDGNLKFDGIRYDIPYYVQEVTPPTGYNLTKPDGVEEGLYSFTIDSSSEVKNISYTWKDEKITGGIRITKTDISTSEPLSGATISIYKNDGTFVNSKGTEMGMVEFYNLEYGDYYFLETDAPEGYVLNTDKHPFSIREDGVIIRDSLTNTKITGGIQISKTDISTSDAIPGATISVYTENDELVDSKVTNSDGIVLFDNLIYGKYYFTETNAPEGYQLNTEKHQFEIKDNGTILTDKLTNTKIVGGIKISKTDISTSAPIPKATISIYNIDNILVASKETAVDGTVLFDNLTYGDYYFLETNAPEGYLLNTEKHPFSIRDNGVILKDTLTNTKITGGIKISKIDISTSLPVPGATVSIYTSDNKLVISKVTGIEGTVQFDSLPYGNYYFLETKAPIGYTLNTEKHTFSIKDNGVILKDTFTNTKIYGGIKISKTDVSTSAPVPGATISLYSSDDKLITSKVTSADGSVEFDKLVYGSYYFLETKAPEGYLLNSEKHSFSIKEDGVILKDALTNTKITGGIIITKSDFSTSAPVPGATISIYTADGKLVVSKVTAADGKAEFNKLDYGNYYFLETKAPEGYLLNTEKHPFSIKEDGVILKDSLTNTMITGTIQIKKIDEAGNSLPGAELTLFDLNGSIVKKAVTDSKGIASFTDINYGEYKVKETKAPEGYNLSDKVVSAKVDGNENGKIYEAEAIVDTKIKADITIKKVDESNNPLSGAEFTLYDSEGKAISSAVSGSDGTLIFKDVVYGNYTIKETKAPKGYSLNDKVLEVQVKSSDAQSFMFNNIKIVAVIPQTGSVIDSSILLILGMLALLSGSVFILRRRLYKNDNAS
ncbi:LPXTG cell wall anchor domain-containing protein [Clostridium sp. YIM B02505]|uniref:LPXTG cell wall anchor domain-containing protein n=1 Tax=Clostridium yunnanense TaxID=2800325 RepID=A0ABS1EVC4_9CLOT|nr:SpaA isopeptide-forming pilin-related protein [Clostridium yunnanense]MBK1813336.1 LPXTG cell wall anchor domain-containing protein [Clostridium yunnanense]